MLFELNIQHQFNFSITKWNYISLLFYFIFLFLIWKTNPFLTLKKYHFLQKSLYICTLRTFTQSIKFMFISKSACLFIPDAACLTAGVSFILFCLFLYHIFDFTNCISLWKLLNLFHSFMVRSGVLVCLYCFWSCALKSLISCSMSCYFDQNASGFPFGILGSVHWCPIGTYFAIILMIGQKDFGFRFRNIWKALISSWYLILFSPDGWKTGIFSHQIYRIIALSSKTEKIIEIVRSGVSDIFIHSSGEWEDINHAFCHCVCVHLCWVYVQ